MRKCSGWLTGVTSACYCHEKVQRMIIFEAIGLNNGGVICTTPNDAAAFMALMWAQILPEPEVRRLVGRIGAKVAIWCTKLAGLPDTTFVWWRVLLIRIPHLL